MNQFNLINYLSKNRLNEAIELTRLYPKNPDKVAQKVADHFTLYDDLDLIYSVKPGSLKMTSNGAYFDLNTDAGPNTPGEDWKDENGFSIDNYLGDFAGGSFVIQPEKGLGEDFFVIRNLANKSAKVGTVTDEEEIIFSSDEIKDFPGFEGTMDALDNLKIREKNSNKMTKKEIKEMIRQNILNELSQGIKEDSEVDFGDSDVGLAKWYGDFYEEMEPSMNEDARTDAEEEGYKDGMKDEKEDLEGAGVEKVKDTEKVDIKVKEPIANEPTLTDDEKAIQGHLDQALKLAQGLDQANSEKLIQQIGNTVTFFTRDFVVKEDVEQSDVESAITGKKLDLKKLEDATKKAMGGDSTDLTVFLAGVFEGKKEYYKDAEADDAAHIKYLEKDMEDDKESSMNESLETLKMKKLAGLLTEGEYAKALLKEYEKSDALLLKKYHDILMKVGGQDLAGDFKDIFNKAKTFKSTLDFIKNDLSILAQDDKDQVNDIKQALNQYSEINL
jgi:hypothetical protein